MGEAFNPIKFLDTAHPHADDSAVARVFQNVPDVTASTRTVAGVPISSPAGHDVTAAIKDGFGKYKSAAEQIAELSANTAIEEPARNTAIKKIKDALAGGESITDVGAHHQTALAHLKNDAELAVKEHGTRVSKIQASDEFRALKTPEKTLVLEQLNEQGKVLTAKTDTLKKFAGEMEPHVSGVTSAEAKTITAASGVSTGGKIFKNTTEATKLGVVGEAAHGKLGTWGKLVANAKANINVASIDKATGAITASTTFGKVAKVGGVGVGAVIGGYGLKDLGQVMGVIGADTDEQGKEIPADGSKLFKAAAELTAGAAAVYFLVKGGKAAGIAK